MAAPTVNAGVDQTGNDATVLILTASMTTNASPIKFYGWTQVSGPDCTMSNPSGCITPVYELYAGTYVFQFSAEAEDNSVATDTCSVTITHTTGPVFLPKEPYPYNFM